MSIIGTSAKVIAPPEQLPPKAKIYAGQTGTIIEVIPCQSGVYHLVEFSNKDKKIYLDNKAAYLAFELEIVKGKYK